MSMNSTPLGERAHIAFFGKRNSGKSSLVNAITGQALSVVSDVEGTTTDPVQKTMELLPLGPVVIIDTPGFDDEGALGQLRVEKTRQVLRRTDIAVLVVGGPQEELGPWEKELIALFEQGHIPYLTVYNKSDLLPGDAPQDGRCRVSARTGAGIWELKETLSRMVPKGKEQKALLDGMMQEGDVVVLVTPIDSAAPKGRLILPQQQVLRDVLDRGGVAVTATEKELPRAFAALKEPPRLVVTDSQAFSEVAAFVPDSVPLTSFSILMARHKGFLEEAVRGVTALCHLQDGDTVLIAEGCTHHRQCDDIGTVKIPRWLRSYTGKTLQFVTTSGGEFPQDLTPYAAVLHCGGCMLNDREVMNRMRLAVDSGVPFTNYGTAIAQMKGILSRSLQPIPEAAGWLLQA